MADYETENNELNNAVEQVETTNAETTEEQQQQNQQTTTSTVATGAETLAAQIAEENLAGDTSAGADGSAGAEDAAEDSGATSNAGAIDNSSALNTSQAVGDSSTSSIDSDASQDTTTDSNAAQQSEIGAQEIGGTSTDADGSDTSGSTATGATSTGTSSAGSASGAAAANDDENFDTQTSGNTFEVNVFDTPENLGDDAPLEGGTEDFDTETTSTTIEVTVRAENDAATADPIDLTMQEDGTILITQDTLLSTASDVDGDTLTAENLVLNQPDQGVLTDNGDGTFTFAPAENFNGNLDFSYDVNDGTVATSNTLNMTVTPVNDNPAALDKEFSMNEDGTFTFSDASLLSGATDVDGDTLEISEVTYSGTDGVFVNNQDGTYTFAPNENFNGSIEGIRYTVTDNAGGTDTAGVKINVAPVNDVPIAGDTAYTMNEDSTITLTAEQLLANSSDVEGDVSLLSVSYQGTDGIFTNNGDGTFSFAPNENFNGDIALDIIVVDNQGAIDTAQAAIEVLPINDQPIAGNTAYTMNEDSVITLSAEQLLANSSDIEGDVTLQDVSYSGTDGILTDNGDGTFSFAPNENFNGDIALDITVVDNQGATANAQANIDVLPINDAPVAGNLAYAIDEDGSITLSQEQLLSQASDVDGDDLSALNLQTENENLTITDNGDGTFTLTPAENFNGDFDITFDVSDGTVTVSANIDLTVNPVNDLPVAVDKQYTINEDSSITITDAQLLQGASDVEGAVSVVDVTYSGTDGVFVSNGDGTYTFSPNENFNGTVDLSYAVADEQGAVVNAGIDINVLPVNDPPIAGDTSYTMNEDSVITLSAEQLLANSTDVDGDVSLLHASYQGTDGIFTNNGDGTFSFAPNENFNGDIALDIIITDANGATDTAQAGISVLPINDAPVVGDLAYSINEDGAITLSQEQLLAFASDVEGDDLTAFNLQTNNDELAITDNGDGTFTLTPAENFNGDFDITFDVSDGTDTVSANIDLTVNPINDLPVAIDKQYTINEDNTITITDAQLLQGASDIEGGVSVADVSYSGTDGVFINNGDGTYTFSPNENFNGSVELSYYVADKQGAVVNADIGINVLPVNDAPVVGDLAYAINEDGSITLSQEQLLAQASDVEGDDLTALNLQTENDNLTITDNGDGTFTLTPDANFNGDLDITFDVSDGTDTVSANIDLTVNPINDVPYALDKSFTMNEDGTITITDAQLLAGAGDVEGPVNVVDVSYTGSDGVFVNNGDGTYTFSPNENFNGDVDLSYTVEDNEGARVSADIDINVAPVNDAPIAGNTSYTMDEDSVITLSAEQLLANASDVEGDVTLHFVAYNGPDGVLSDNGDGTFSFAPNENFNGTIDIGIVVADQDGAVDTGTASINVLPINDAPVVGDLAYVLNEDGSIILSQEQLLAQASDVEGDDLTAFNLQTENENLTITDNGDGTFTLTPAANFNGDLDITFDVTDGTDTVAANIDLTVNPINDLPYALDKSFTMEEDGTITITDDQLLAGAGDVEGGVSIADVSYDGADGILRDNGDGTYTFSPNENFNGNVDLSYSVADEQGANVDAQIDIFVAPVNDPPV